MEKDNVLIVIIVRMIFFIKFFYDYLFLNYICVNNFVKDIKKFKIKKENINIFIEEEIERLLNFLKLIMFKLIRDKVIFEVLYGIGIKVFELVEMNIEDIDLDIDYIYCNLCCKN